MDVLRLYSFKGDALSWSVRIVGTSGPPQRSYSQRNTVGVEACRRRGGGRRRRRNRTLVGTITTTTTNTWLTSGLQLHYASNFCGNEFHHWSIVESIVRLHKFPKFLNWYVSLLFVWNKCFVSLSLICTVGDVILFCYTLFVEYLIWSLSFPKTKPRSNCHLFCAQVMIRGQLINFPTMISFL